MGSAGKARYRTPLRWDSEAVTIGTVLDDDPTARNRYWCRTTCLRGGQSWSRRWVCRGVWRRCRGPRTRDNQHAQNDRPRCPRSYWPTHARGLYISCSSRYDWGAAEVFGSEVISSSLTDFSSPVRVRPFVLADGCEKGRNDAQNVHFEVWTAS